MMMQFLTYLKSRTRNLSMCEISFIAIECNCFCYSYSYNEICSNFGSIFSFILTVSEKVSQFENSVN